MDRAKLVRRRQRLRLKEQTTGRKEGKENDSGGAQRAKATSKPIAGADKLAKATAIARNPALMVRQILQSVEYGEASALLQSVGKQEIEDQLVAVAGYARDLKGRVDECNEAAEIAVHQQSARYNKAASELIQRDSHIRELIAHIGELEQRLARADDEYKALLKWISEKEDKWKASEQAKRDQTELIRGMAAVQKQQEDRLRAISHDLEQAVRYAHELHTENADLSERLDIQERETSRLESELSESRSRAQEAMWQLRQKTQELAGTTQALEEAKGEVLALRDEVQVEILTRQTTVIDREKMQQQLQKEQREWRSKQDIWESSDQRTTQQLRRLDFELRQLKQTTSRLRAEIEGEKAQREKAEANALKLAGLLDEAKEANQTIDSERKRLRLKLDDERAELATKDNALQNAYRGLQTLQKCCRDERTAKEEAKRDLDALTQRINATRQEHSAHLERF